MHQSCHLFLTELQASQKMSIIYIYLSNNCGFKVTFILQLWGDKLMPEK